MLVHSLHPLSSESFKAFASNYDRVISRVKTLDTKKLSKKAPSLVLTATRTPSQMVAVYDVVEIAGISYGMISKTLAYDLNRNHTM